MIKVLNVGTVPTVCYIFVVRIYAFKGHGYNKGHNKVPIRVISIIRKSSNPNRPHNNKINVEIYSIAKTGSHENPQNTGRTASHCGHKTVEYEFNNCKTGHHDITVILLLVALNTITLYNPHICIQKRYIGILHQI